MELCKTERKKKTYTTYTCCMCGHIKSVRPSAIGRGRGKYCSISCRGKAQIKGTAGFKTCTWCNLLKPNTEFWPRKSGLLAKCKPCCRANTRSDKYAYDKRRNASVEHRLKLKARRSLADAVRRKRLLKSNACEHCRTVKPVHEIHGHHINGYEQSHWLDVQWLCSGCHRQVHRMAPATGFEPITQQLTVADSAI